MSRLRRLVLSDRFFFVTVNLRPARRPLDGTQFAVLARCFQAVRSRQQFRLTAWVFMPDHWHAILYPPSPLTISAAIKSIKLSSTNALGRCRGETGEVWQRRFFDHALRTVKDYTDTVEYIHLNPVRQGLVRRPEDWVWSSYHEYAGVSAAEREKRCGLAIDRVRLPADESTRI